MRFYEFSLTEAEQLDMFPDELANAWSTGSKDASKNQRKDKPESYSRLDWLARNQKKPRSQTMFSPDEFDFDDDSSFDMNHPEKSTKQSTKANPQATGDQLGTSIAAGRQMRDGPEAKKFLELREVLRSQAKDRGHDTSGGLGWPTILRIFMTNNNFDIDVDASEGMKGLKTIFIHKIAPEKHVQLREMLDKLNLPVAGIGSDKKDVKVFIRSKIDKIEPSVFDVVWKVVDFLESLGDEFEAAGGQRGSGAGSLIPKTKKSAKWYNHLATNLVSSYMNDQGWSLSRGGGDSVGGFDVNDPQIIVGITKEGYRYREDTGKKPYREHAVPCDLINRIGIDICKQYEGKNGKITRNTMAPLVGEVARMIYRNLMIVETSFEERDILDVKLKLKTTMPEGWQDNDNPLARFIAAGIAVYSKDSGQRLSESK